MVTVTLESPGLMVVVVGSIVTPAGRLSKDNRTSWATLLPRLTLMLAVLDSPCFTCVDVDGSTILNVSGVMPTVDCWLGGLLAPGPPGAPDSPQPKIPTSAKPNTAAIAFLMCWPSFFSCDYHRPHNAGNFGTRSVAPAQPLEPALAQATKLQLQCQSTRCALSATRAWQIHRLQGGRRARARPL